MHDNKKIKAAKEEGTFKYTQKDKENDTYQEEGAQGTLFDSDGKLIT